MFRTVYYKIKSYRLPEEFEGFRIVHLSDLHGAVYGKQNRKLIEGIQKARPDAVVMTGDMADHSRHAIERLVGLSRRLCRRYPVYYVVGNHEQCLKESALTSLIRKLEAIGVTVLENSRHTITRGNASVQLYGLVTPMVYYKDRLREYEKGIDFSAEEVRKALGNADKRRFGILLAHNPLYYPSYRRWGADLTFSGHIHGGIIRIPGLGGLLSPDLTLFPRYDGGYFQEKGKHLVVSRGLGNHFLVRVLNPPELVVATLHTGACRSQVPCERNSICPLKSPAAMGHMLCSHNDIGP